MTPAFHRTFAGIAIGIVGIALIWGFLIVGSPGTGREQKFDERRLEDLRAIQNEIVNIVYAQEPWRGNQPPELKQPLPATLDEVVAKAYYQRPNIIDPETQNPYGYRVIDNTNYALCATFNFARDVAYDVRWNHPAGNHCYAFDLTQNPNPSEPKPIPAPAL